MAIPTTVVIPAYNDAMGLDYLLSDLLAFTEKKGLKVIVVNDCSSDNTNEVLKKYVSRIKVLGNETNLGFGGAFKRGIWAAETEWVATFDTDKQHRISDLESLADQAVDKVDAVIGMRDSDSHVTKSRVSGKWILSKAANFITGRKIPDINCGLRVFRRGVLLYILLAL
ncbi:glycosyltransferase family 2 protein [Maridesulfovibrio sp.]|uniref:glycosyltransferase family 2 protein n=1 Tax=Maridesulfovibrio sp. TaxID=2795000 RepID=UPI0029CA1DA8|nr:glycosyltransferase family 2 protein [Maridesulfovibrio sp.]